MQITVPSNLDNKPTRIDVNGVSYLLMPGETINVPDAVNAEMLRMIAAQDNPAPAVEKPFEDAELKAALASANTALSALTSRVAALEEGGGGGSSDILIVGATMNGDDLFVLDKNFNEIFAADFAVINPGELYGYRMFITEVVPGDGGDEAEGIPPTPYFVFAVRSDYGSVDTLAFTADSATGTLTQYVSG